MHIQKDVLSFGFTIAGHFQFLFALLIPAVKAMNKRILRKMVTKMAGINDQDANVVMSFRLSLHYALFVAVRMSGAEIPTIVSVLIVDFLLQLRMVHQIFQLKRKVSKDQSFRSIANTRMEKEISKLLLAELTEGLVPVVYVIGFSMAYYGPNGHLTGNVLSDLWSYEKVKDATRLFFVQFLLFGIDLVSVIVNTFILYKFGNVNLIEKFCMLLKNYWMTLVILMTLPYFRFFILTDINLAGDMTLKFDWITVEGRMAFICDSTDLNDYEKSILFFNCSSY